MFNLTISPFLESSLAALSITPGLTVDICGLLSGHMIVAIMLPPNAGLVCLILPSSSSISNLVQSAVRPRSEEHTSELQSRQYLVCRLLLEKKITHYIPRHGCVFFTAAVRNYSLFYYNISKPSSAVYFFVCLQFTAITSNETPHLPILSHVN